MAKAADRGLAGTGKTYTIAGLYLRLFGPRPGY